MTRADRTHGPLRTCIGCRRRADGRALVRVTRRNGAVDVDGPSSGRGAWLCRDEAAPGGVAPACLDRALSAGGFERAWRTKLDEQGRAVIVRALRGADDHPDAR